MKTFLVSVILLATTGFIFKDEIANIGARNRQGNNIAVNSIDIRQKWDLPPVLLEVSGIAWMDDTRFACVQDEAGTIFIYNLASGRIEKEIPFAGAGDFEGISLNGNTAYVVRSDGKIFEVNMATKHTKEYASGLTLDNNVESIFFDKTHNRLLLAGKEPDEDKAYKNIYEFSLSTGVINKNPFYRIDLSNPYLNTTGKSKKKKQLMPSAIAIHPTNGDIYVVDGPKSRLVVIGNKGELKKVVELGSAFYKPEGISFSPSGDLYISNEGKKIPANIIKLELRN